MEHHEELNLHDLEAIVGGYDLTEEEDRRLDELIVAYDKAVQDRNAGLGNQATVDAAYADLFKYADSLRALRR